MADAKVESIINKAINALGNAENEDALYGLVKVKVEDTVYTVSIGKCRGNNRPFPCIVIDNGARQYTFSAMQLAQAIKVLNALSDNSYEALMKFINQAASTRPSRPKRTVKEDAAVEESEEENEEEEVIEEVKPEAKPHRKK
ncbi:MAG: hypothetical protein RXQ94_09520 [Caldivirga sp.]